MKPLVYVVGPYSASTPEGIRRNIEHAQKWAAAINKTGLAYAVCPHSLSDGIATSLDERGWLRFTRDLSLRCDALAMIPGWRLSDGSRGEVAANVARVPLWDANFSTLDDVPDGVQYLIDRIERASLTPRMKP